MSFQRTETIRTYGLAVLIPVVALAAQSALWPWIQPFVWFFFFPATFFSARWTGFRGGMVSTAISVVLAWFFFIPPRFSFSIESPAHLVTMAMFVVMGYLLSGASESLRRARADVEDRFSNLFGQSGVGFALVDIDGRFRDANSKLCEMLGFSREELLAKSFLDITHPDDIPASIHLRDRIFSEAARPAPIEKRYIDKDGEIVWANLTISWVRKKDGAPDYWISSIEDITERKRVEAQLAVVIGRLAEAQRLARLGHWSRDIKTGTRFWSEEMFRAWGRDPSLGAPSNEENPAQYITRESFAKLAPMLARCRSEGEAYECDVEIVRPAGDRCWVTLRGVGVRDASGAVAQMHGTVQDITRSKQAEAALVETSGRLAEAQRVAGIAHWTRDTTTGNAYWSNETYRIHGLDPSLAPPQSFDELRPLFTPESWVVVSALMERCRREGVPGECDAEIIRPDGEHRWICVRGAAKRDASGASVQLHGTIQDITGRKQAEARLMETGTRLEEAQRLSGIGHWTVDEKTGEQYWSEQTYRIHGRDPSLGPPGNSEELRAMFTPESWAAISALIVRCQREGVPYECDVEIIRPDGERRWVSARGEANRDASGVVTQAHGTIQDITERKLADAALAETTARLKEAQHLTGIGHWTRDLRTDTPYWSAETYRIHGRDPSLGPPKHYSEVRSDFTPEGWAIVSAALKRLREEGVPYELDAEIVAPNGERRWASLRGAAQRDASGAIIQTHGTVQDINERKLAAEALAETTAKLKEAQHVAGIGHWTLNTKTGQRYWSEETYRIHGLDPALGPPVDYVALSACFTPESWAVLRVAMERLIGEGVPYEFDAEIIRPDGEHRWINVHGAASRDENGIIVQTHGTLQDITERKRADTELAETTARLREAQRIAKIGHWSRDLKTGAGLWSQEMFRIFERDPSLGPPAADEFGRFFTPESWEKIKSAFELIRTGGVPDEIDVELARPKGERRWVTMRAAPTVDGNGVVVAIHGTSQDITARKRVEQALSESEERNGFLLALGDALENLSDPDDIQEAACAALGRHIDGNQVLYAEIDPTDTFAVISRDWSDGSMASNVGVHRLADFGPEFIDDLRVGKTVFIDDIKADPRTGSPEAQATFQARNIAAFISVPRVKHNRLVCVLSVHSRSVRRWSALDVSLIEDVGERTWAAVERARAEQALRESEQALSESEEQLHLFIEHAPADLAMFDRDMRYLAVSRRWIDNYKLGAEVLIGRSHYDVFPELPEEWKELHRRGLAGEVVRQDDDRLVRADGSVIWLRREVRPWRRSNGEVGGIVVFSEDITESKRSQNALQHSEARLRTILDGAPAYIYLKDLEGRYLFANAAVRQLMNAELDEIIGFGDEKFFDAETVADVHARDLRVLENGETVRAEEIATLAETGEKGAYLSVKLPLRDQNGDIYALCGISTDITERVRAEALLSESERRYRSLFENMNAGFVLFEVVQDDRGVPVDLIVLAANEGFDKATGLKGAEIIGQRLTEALPGIENDPADWIGLYGTVALTGQSCRFEQGSALLGSVFSVAAYQPAPKQCSVTFDNITERIRTEEEILRLNAQLERRVAERTAELNVARGKAEAASAAKGAFLANMSHEIRTPMNTIMGLTHLLKHEVGPGRQHERLAHIDDAAQHLLSLIDNILDMSKIEAGRLNLESHAFELRELLADVVTLTGATARAKGIRFDVDTDHVPVRLSGDVTRLRQALINYVNNAVKFTETGFIALRARRLEETETELVVRFEVEDSGVGVDSDILPRLFNAFEQADASITRKYGGTGLGLAITRQLAEAMGGHAGAQSQPGVGSLFWFSARLTKCPGASAADNPLAHFDPVAHLGAKLDARVLLVEDNDINREVAVELLRVVGLTVVTAANGREALEKARAQTFDLILMDVQMPVMDGMEATREIRKLPGRAAIPIVAISANVFIEDRRACADAGMNDFVTKPVEPLQLYATLARWLSRSAGAAETATDGAPTSPVSGAGLVFDPPVPGLDAEEGLRRLGGNVNLYRRLMRRFVNDHADDIVLFRKRFDGQDRQGALLTAHSLRGAAGNLGAKIVMAASARLEDAVRNGGDTATIDQASSVAQAELKTLVEAIFASLTQEVVFEPNSAADSVATQEMLKELEAALVAGDVRANQLFAASASMIKRALRGSGDAFENQIANYLYPEALETLKGAGHGEKELTEPDARTTESDI